MAFVLNDLFQHGTTGADIARMVLMLHQFIECGIHPGRELSQIHTLDSPLTIRPVVCQINRHLVPPPQ